MCGGGGGGGAVGGRRGGVGVRGVEAFHCGFLLMFYYERTPKMAALIEIYVYIPINLSDLNVIIKHLLIKYFELKK